MGTENPSPQAGRPRPLLLMALGVVLVIFLAMRFWPGNPAVAPAAPSNPGRAAAAEGGDVRVDPSELDVRLEALNAQTAAAEAGDRNPFRFKPKPPPPPPPPPPFTVRPVDRPPSDEPAGPPQPPPPPPIPLKFIGIVEPKPGDRVAAFSDCRSTTSGREGSIILGQFRLVRIGIESVVMEYLDGRGRTTIRLSGQDCVK
jgi:hypothetical protein